MKNKLKLLLITINILIGLIIITCDLNNGTFSPTHEHKWGGWTQTTPPTCTEAGIKTKVCTLDPSHIDTETQVGDPALGHDWEILSGTASTCITNGNGHDKCKRCGHEENGELPLDPNNHDWEILFGTGSNCTFHGNGHGKCRLCGGEEIGELPLVPSTHSWGNWVLKTPATCSTAGMETRTCILNATHEETKPISINPTAHDSGEWIITKPATSTETGARELSCTLCGAVLNTDTIPMIVPIIVPGASFNQKMLWLISNAQSNGYYTIEVDSDNTISPQTLSFSGRSNINITLIGIGAKRTFSLSANGSMFTIESSITLILDNNLELHGRNGNSSFLIQVNSGGKFIINNGIKITGNNGGVDVANNGSFTMNGGEISENNGKGVNINNGIFTMNSGIIKNNTSSGTSNGPVTGGGVCLTGGTFTMNGGEISNNTISGNSGSISGGGVRVTSGTFIMNNGKISSNSAIFGGGVCITSGTFIMNSGEISNNTLSNNSIGPTSGGGVYMSGGTFIMDGGEISNNTVSYNSISPTSGGGGVDLRGGTFTMNGGEISGNSSDIGGGVRVSSGTYTMSGGKISGNSSVVGGGVYVDKDGNFTFSGGDILKNSSQTKGGGVYVNSSIFNKIGGTIFGYVLGDINSNFVKNSSGVIQQNQGHAVITDHSNSIYIMGKDSTSGSTDNLSFNGRVNPPAWGGSWDY